jgi:hypothetical protein
MEGGFKFSTQPWYCCWFHADAQQDGEGALVSLSTPDCIRDISSRELFHSILNSDSVRWDGRLDEPVKGDGLKQ